MSIPGAASPLFLATTAGAAGPFEISRSLRFSSGDSAYLSRTPSSAGNRKTWTWSGWVKKGTVGAIKSLFGSWNGSTSSTYFSLIFVAADKLRIEDLSVTYRETTQVFRDASSWYHIVLSVDTTNATANDRIKLYVNGSQVTDFSTTNNPSQNADLGINGTHQHGIGRPGAQNAYYFDGYLAEINFIDGAALGPSSFGQADANGVWQAKNTAGLTFGTNGFRLKFADNSGSTATTLGKDTSGNSNNWTPNNLSAGTVSNLTAKQNFDVVTYTGTGSSQTVTGLSFQPDFIWLKNRDDANGWHQFRDVARGGNKNLASNSNIAETDASNKNVIFNSNGFTLTGTTGSADDNQSGDDYVAWCWKAGGAASSNSNGTITSSVSANASYGFSICTYTGNNTSGASVGHSLNAVPALIILKDRSSAYNWQVYHKSFAGTSNGIVLNSSSGIDSGSGAVWNSTTPTSTVFSIGNSVGVNKSGDNYVAYVWSEIAGFSKFSSYTGNGGSKAITGLGFKPRFVLIRSTGIGSWMLFDSARGVGQYLKAQTNGAEATANISLSFGSDGFSFNTSDSDFNGNGQTYIYAAFAATIDEAAINDCFVDTPTNAAEPTDTGVGNEVVGNYCTLNPLAKPASTTYSNGNLDITTSSGWYSNACSIGISSGKWYYEFVRTGGSYAAVGWRNDITTAGNPPHNANGGGIYNSHNGTKQSSAGSSSYGATWAIGDVIGVAFDRDAGTITFYKNGASQGQAFSGMTDGTFYPEVYIYQSSGTLNFGQRAFAHTAPSGYKSLNTANLPTPTIADGSKYFEAKTYNGNGGTAQTISGLNFSPDFIWYKHQSGTSSHGLFDIVRGVNSYLSSNSTAAQINLGNFGLTAVSAFNSDGFSLGNDTGANGSGTFVAWTWDGGTSTVTNNDGSIASQVRAQPSAGFSICTYTGTEGGTFGHGLNAAPKFVMVKRRNTTADWCLWHTAISNTQYLMLNNTTAASSWNVWGNTSPTSSVVSVSGDSYTGNNGDTYVAYCFAPVEGYSAIGKYTGSGSNDGSFIFTGFAVKWVLIKCTSAAGQEWVILDSARSPSNVVDDALYANESAAEASNSTRDVDFLSNGFKLRNGSSGATDLSGRTYLYYAVAKNPFQANGGLAR